MIKKTNLQDLLNSIQGKIDSVKSKQGKNQAKNQSQKENLLNYNKGLDSTQDWGGMISISKQSEKNPQDKEQSENTTSKSTKNSASELQKILNNLNLNKTKKNTSAEKSSAPQTKTPAQQTKTKIRTINIPGKKISAPQSTIDTTPAQTKESTNVPDSTKVVNVEPMPDGPGPNIPDIIDTPVQTVEPTIQPIVEQIDDTKTKTTYPNGNYSVQTDKSIILYDKDGNKLISYRNYNPVLDELNNFNCDGEKISLTFKNSKIDLIKGDKVVKHYSIIVENNINNTVKVYNTDGSLNSQSSILPGKKGSVEYVADLLGINVDISDCNIEYDENGRVTYFYSNRINNAMHMDGGGINHSAKISYNDETNEMTINYDYFECHGTQITSYSKTLTYDANGKLTKSVDGNTTTVYDKNGGYTATIVDEEGNILQTTVATLNENGNSTVRTDKADGSWNLEVEDARGNLISREGKAVISGYKYLNGITIKNYSEEPAEVTYSMNSDGEMTVDANNVTIVMDLLLPNNFIIETIPLTATETFSEVIEREDIISANNYSNALIEAEKLRARPKKLIIKGDNNEINGSFRDDNVKVIGNNNKINLGAGEDTLVAIGENNTVNNVENVTNRSKDIPAGELGSVEYVMNLLDEEDKAQYSPKLQEGESITVSDNVLFIKNTEKDEEGRVTRITAQSNNMMIATGPTQYKYYDILYADNGEVTIKQYIGGYNNSFRPAASEYEYSLVVEMEYDKIQTFDAKGELIREETKTIGPI